MGKPKAEKFVEADKERATRVSVTAKTGNQKIYLNHLDNKVMVVAKGHAGVGKTYLAAVVAAQKYLRGEVDTIIVTRPIVGLGKSTGFWPGTIEDKITPYLVSVLSTIKKCVGDAKFNADIGKNILIQPLEAVRGRSFDNSFIIVDETQNTVPDEIRALTTRLGENSQIVFCGDSSQSDIRGQNGLDYLVDILGRYQLDEVGVVEFTADDVVRSDITAKFAKIHEKEAKGGKHE